MIPFFRRIRHALLSGNQMVKYMAYAIGEIALVVIGILIALQINNWNEFRKEKRIEKVVLQDIHDNIERNDELIRKAIETIDQINASTEKVKKFIQNKSPFSDTLGYHINQSLRSGTFLFKLNFDGYEALKSTGFNIIQNEELKDEILKLFEVDYGYLLTSLNFSNSFYLENLSWWKEFFYSTDSDVYLPYDLNQFYNNKRLLTELHEIEFIRNDFKLAIQNSLKNSAQVLSLLTSELQKSNSLE